jgi:hypothetical protein
MADVIHFMPRGDIPASENVNAFVSLARDTLTAFGPDLRFEDDVWDITEAINTPGQPNRNRISFCTLSNPDGRTGTPMQEPFRQFAKAYIRYMHGLKPTNNPQFRLAALRSLEQALTENGNRPLVHTIDTHNLNRAAQIIKAQFSQGAAYRIAGQLETLSELLATKRLATVSFRWRNPLSRPADAVRVGKAFEQRRQEKMPSAAVLEALAIAFRTATGPADVIIVSASALMCAAPDRIGEVLTMRFDCEVIEERRGKDPAYGLRWWPAKGADPMIKWVISSMAKIVKTALANIRAHTAEARRIATWYEENPHKIYLPEDLEHLRFRKHLDLPEVTAITGQPKALQWMVLRGIPTGMQAGRWTALFADVEAAILKLLPDGFPVFDRATGLKYSEALFVVEKNLFHAKKGTWACIIEPVCQRHIRDGLGGRLAYGASSLFSRLGLTNEDGSEIRINSHKFRHYLKTLAQKGGLSQLDIAKWSGRRDVRQNRAYDHMSGNEILQRLRGAIGDDNQMFGPLARVQVNTPMTQSEFAALQVPTAHSTDIGFCIHDFTMLPCPIHRDCINCNEHVCIKGDQAKARRVHERLGEAKRLLAAADAGEREGFEGADRWREHHMATVARLEELSRLLDDPALPAGSVIQLDHPSADSPVRLARRQRGESDAAGSALLSPGDSGQGITQPAGAERDEHRCLTAPEVSRKRI